MRIETLLHTLTDCDRAYTSVLPQGFFNDDMHSLIFYVLFIKNGFGIIRLSSSGFSRFASLQKKNWSYDSDDMLTGGGVIMSVVISE